MRVNVRLFAYLRKGRFKNQDMEFPEQTTVLDVLKTLSINAEELKIGIILVNGKHATFERLLQDGDILAIFPPVAGG